MHLLRWLPARRVELLVVVLLTLGSYALTGFLHAQHADDVALLLILVTLEIILPFGMGLISAGLIAGDPALDLLLSAHRPAWQTLLVRLIFIGAVGVLLCSFTLVLATFWILPLPKAGVAQLYIWLSPMVFYMGLSSAVSLLRGRMLDGVLVALGVMGISLMMLSQIPRLCAANLPGEACLGWLASPMMTLGNPADAYWPLNRLFWLFLGLALIGISLRLTRREEALLYEVSKE